MEDKVYTDEQICGKSVDENEVLYDYQEEFVKKLWSVDISCPEELTAEVMKNMSACSTLLLLSMKQAIISTQPRVRYHPDHDMYGLRKKIFGTGLSAEVRDFFKSMSDIGCRVLEHFGMLETLVELDSERPGKVVAFGKTLKMVGSADILVCANQSKLKHVPVKQKTDHSKSSDISDSSQTTDSLSTSGIENPSDSIGSSGRQMRFKRKAKKYSTSEDSKRKEISDNDENHHETTDIGGEPGTVRAVVTVAVTGRNHLNVTAIYKQLLLAYLHTLSKFYFLVLHIGPLVDKQEIALYEYLPGQKLTELVKSYDSKEMHKEVENAQIQNQFEVSLTVHKTVSLKPPSIKEPTSDKNYLDVNEVEKCFREVKGNRIRTVAGLKQYFKYLFSDCPGVKDHHEDKKNRYERYMAKKEEKRQKKRQSRQTSIDEEKTPLPEKHKEVAFEFSTKSVD